MTTTHGFACAAWTTARHYESRSRTLMNQLHAFILATLLAAPSLEAQRVRAGDSATVAAVRLERAALSDSADGRPAVAVMRFTMQSADSALAPLGYGIAELLADDLSRSHGLRVLERLRVAELEGEKALQASAGADSATRVAAQGMLGAQHLITGQVIVPSDTSRTTLRSQSIMVESGDIELRRVSSGAFADIFRIEHDLALATFDAYGITLSPSEKRALDERVAPTLSAFIAFSHGVRAESSGDDEEAARAYEQAARLDRSFKLAQVKLASTTARVASKSATGPAPIGGSAPTSTEGAKASAAAEAKSDTQDGVKKRTRAKEKAKAGASRPHARTPVRTP